MAGIDENLKVWSEEWDWSDAGEGWSDWWGGTEALWFGVILPRIHAFVPTGTVLEIAPGYGRWTNYLKDVCDRLVAVDLTEGCVEYCRDRFSQATHLEFHVNDGRSLAMVEDDSVDFAFSFDSLVHVDEDVLGSYLEQLGMKLKPNGIGLFHHSNLGSYRTAVRMTIGAARHLIPQRFVRPMVEKGLLVNLGAWRAENMTAGRFVQLCEAAGLACIGQELISWEHGGYQIDTLSMFTRRGSAWERPARVSCVMRNFAERRPGWDVAIPRAASLASNGCRRRRYRARLVRPRRFPDVESNLGDVSEAVQRPEARSGRPSARFLRSRRDDIHTTALSSQFGYVNRQLNRMVQELLTEARLQPGAKVVDFGCVDRPYASFLQTGVEYVGVDLPGNPAADLEIAPDGTMPIPSQAADLVLSTQVLEHVADPGAYLGECARVLRPGGKLLLSTHGIMYYHPDPEDYWRWTCAGLRRIVEDQGFQVMELRGLLGLVAASLQLIQDRTCWGVPRRLRWLYIIAMQALIALSDRQDTDASRETNSWTIAILARKV